ncbi:MAG TPA: hypothetical protein VGQ05_08230 [Streptosporangiaceae bacterium]|jgi:hypothetical protein|nr:hypothetical protein [Streptosporangiaceae bacterium]
MPDLENLLREELQHEAQKVQPELLRPLQVPTRQPSWRPRLLPFAAAAAVIAVITAGALAAGLTTAHKPAAHKPAVSGSAPAGLPRFYVTTSSGPGGRGIQAVVRASASGQVTGTVPVPSALPVEWADSGGTFVTAAADDRSFIIGVQGGQAPTKNGLDLRLFRFAISAAGKPGHLTELAPAPMRNEITEGIALSPDGKLLAVSLMRDSPAGTVGAIQVLDLATGATRTWTAPAHSVYIPGPPSWADGSRVIAFTWLRSTQSGLMSAPRGIRLLDTAAPGDNLVAGTVIVPSGMVAAGSIVSALITPDGRDVIVVTWRDLTPQASTHTIVVQFAKLQASTGRLVRLLRTQTRRYDQVHVITLQDSLGVLSLGSQGRYALVQGIQFGWLDVSGPDLGRFTPLPAVPAGQYVNFAAW